MGIAWCCRMRPGLSEAGNPVCPLDYKKQARLPAPLRLFRRTRVGVGFDVAPLLVHDAAQLALHRLERVVNHFV